jgi:hypothetical protein
MSTPMTVAASATRRLAASAGRNNQPDPRPITDYTAVYSEPGGTHSRVTVTLAQPCVIRNPKWQFVDASDGSVSTAQTITVASNTTIVFDFTGTIAKGVCFIQPPYQDMEVQNFQGGFVRPGAQWFRAAG